jgi:hypothetical protein
LALVRQHEQRALQYTPLFCEWLGTTPTSLEFLLDLHRNPRYWEQTEPGRWEFRGWSTSSDDSMALSSAEPCQYVVNGALDKRERPKYIVVGRGYPV